MSAIVIEQEVDAVKLAVEVHRNATLAEMRMSRANMNSNPLVSIDHGAIAVEFKFKAKALEIGKDRLVVEVAFSMVGAESAAKELSEKRAVVVKVECAFQATYNLSPEFQLSTEHAEAFLNGNAIFNTWPYFREYLQSSLTRMGYPALVAPFVVMKPKPRKPEKTVVKQRGSTTRSRQGTSNEDVSL